MGLASTPTVNMRYRLFDFKEKGDRESSGYFNAVEASCGQPVAGAALNDCS
jgi:hypothetical protein